MGREEGVPVFHLLCELQGQEKAGKGGGSITVFRANSTLDLLVSNASTMQSQII